MIIARAVRAKGGRRADLDNQYFRSRAEANYARYLRWLQRKRQIFSWSYEPTEFEFPVKRGVRFYKPDFGVTEMDGRYVYHEVKGWMDDESRVKLERMARYYPEVKVIIIDDECYRDIAKKLGRAIEGWE